MCLKRKLDGSNDISASHDLMPNRLIAGYSFDLSCAL